MGISFCLIGDGSDQKKGACRGGKTCHSHGSDMASKRAFNTKSSVKTNDRSHLEKRTSAQRRRMNHFHAFVPSPSKPYAGQHNPCSEVDLVRRAWVGEKGRGLEKKKTCGLSGREPSSSNAASSLIDARERWELDETVGKERGVQKKKNWPKEKRLACQISTARFRARATCLHGEKKRGNSCPRS